MMMRFILDKLPLFVDLLFCGPYILVCLLDKAGYVPYEYRSFWQEILIGKGAFIMPVSMFFVTVTQYLSSPSFIEYFRKHLLTILVFLGLVITWADEDFAFWFSCLHLWVQFVMLYWPKQDRKSINTFGPTPVFFRFHAAQLVILTFFGLILLGTFLLVLPVSSLPGKSINFIDALFMVTSATCVTGLSTISLISDMSFFGQMVILICIQIGGLGIMILYSSMTIFVGRNMPMKERVMMQDILDINSMEDLINIILDIIKYTCIIELWGALILTLAFSLDGMEISRAIYYGIYHSISAFCNAGFALFDNSLESYGTNPMIHGTISILITLGGLGFIVLKEVTNGILEKKSFARLGLHTKIVLTTSALITLAGTIIIFFGEFLHALDTYTFWEKLQISFFQSVTLRTAGFTTIPLSTLHSHTTYIMILFMFIGGSPGSTAGGLKTSAFAILIQSIRSTLNGRDSVEIFDRTIPNSLVVKTTALSFISIIIITLFIFILMKIEPLMNLHTLAFEAVSALATVGLTLGITTSLSALGKFAIIMLMFIGRVGPLTLVLAVGTQVKSVGKIVYPAGKVMIG